MLYDLPSLPAKVQRRSQNHYLTFGYASPMIFLNKRFWTEEVPAWPLIMNLMDSGRYKNLILCLTDSNVDVLQVLQSSAQQAQSPK